LPKWCAGNLIGLFGLDYELAVMIVGGSDAGIRNFWRHDRDHLGANY